MIQRRDVFTCDMCKATEHTVEGSYEAPLEWLTIRISSLATCAGSDDLHICASCKYEDLNRLWENI